jgi:hypothetical protein
MELPLESQAREDLAPRQEEIPDRRGGGNAADAQRTVRASGEVGMEAESGGAIPWRLLVQGGPLEEGKELGDRAAKERAGVGR